MATIDTRRRVKHYVLNDARQWVDRGTGHVSWIYNDKQRSVSLVVKSEADSSVLLEAKILLSIVYQRQQDTLIVWSDTSRRDLALSFQEKAGCDEIWEKICEVLGEDSSLDTTSSRAAAASADNLDESDEDQLDSDINTSPNSDLPPCELSKLREIRDFFTVELARKSKIYKERLSTVLETDTYIKKLIELFHICEDLDNTEGLNYLFDIFRSLFYLNKSSLLDILLCDELIMHVIGCLEYDPNKKDAGFTKHRDYIATKSNFKEIIPFRNVDLVAKIHQTYKVQYIQDVILPAPSVFEENSLTSLSSFVFLNKVEISNLIQEDDRFLNELFEEIKKPSIESNKRRDILLFLREYSSFLHGLQQTREPFFRSLYEHGILDVIENILDLKDDELSPVAIDILCHLVEVSPTMVREFILNEIEAKSSINNLNSSLNKSDRTETNSVSPSPSQSRDHITVHDVLNTDDVFEPILINYVIRQMINDPDPELSGALQILNILKLLIDPENMLSAVNKAEKSEFLSYFYRKSMTIIINPLMVNTSHLRIHRDDFRVAQLENLIIDFLTFCVEHHTFHIKNYILHKDLLKRVLVLLKSKHQFVALTALKFLRKTIGLKEDIYNRYIAKQNLLEPVVDALCSTASRYNILNSAIIELFDFVRTDDIKSLMVYVIEQFNERLEPIGYVKTFRDLKTRYEQHKDKLNELTRTRLNSSDTTPSASRTRSERYQDRLEFDKDEDAWIEEDDDDTKENKTESPHINSSSSSSSSNSTDETNFESYLELKKSKSINLDENEDTLFSPAKSISPPTSPNSSIGRKTITKSISIKISQSSVKAIGERVEDTTNNQRKHALVDYEDDSEDEDMAGPVENPEPVAKRAATDTNSVLHKLADADKKLVDVSKKEEGTVIKGEDDMVVIETVNTFSDEDKKMVDVPKKEEGITGNDDMVTVNTFSEEDKKMVDASKKEEGTDITRDDEMVAIETVNTFSDEDKKMVDVSKKEQSMVHTEDDEMVSPVENTEPVAEHIVNSYIGEDKKIVDTSKKQESTDHAEEEDMSSRVGKRTATDINPVVHKPNDEDKNLVDTSKKEENKENEVVASPIEDKSVNSSEASESDEPDETSSAENESTEVSNGKFPNINNVNGAINGSRDGQDEADESTQAPLSPIIAEQPAHKRARLSNS